MRNFANCLLLFGSFLVSVPAVAQFVPLPDDAPAARKTFDDATFDFVVATLHAGRLAPEMICDLRVTSGKDLRKFSTGSEWVEYFEVDFRSNAGGGGHKIVVKFPKTSKYGMRKQNHPLSGVAEEFKIEAGDRDEHWLRFSHDGKGHINGVMMGDLLRTIPCIIRD